MGHPYGGGRPLSLSCSACTSCSATAQCTNASLQFFTDAACATSLVKLAVNTTCVSTNGGGNFKSFTYSVTLADAQCTGTGPIRRPPPW